MSSLSDQAFLEHWRRDLHRFPETGWEEFRTSALLAEELHRLDWHIMPGRTLVDEEQLLGWNAELIAPAKQRALAQGASRQWLEWLGDISGVGAELDSGRPGPVIALRFDIDALEVNETAALDHRPNQLGFTSENPGIMHACGHDGHTAIGIALARRLAENRHLLNGRIKLLFQPAEEGCKAGKAIAAGGWLDDVDYFLAAHLGVNGKSGTLVTNPCNFLCSTKFDITVDGVAAHAGLEPNAGANALATAATIVTQLLAIPRHRQGMTRVNIGYLSSGEGRNVIPEHALLKGETRGESTELNQFMMDQVKRIVSASADMHGTHARVLIQGEATSVNNSTELVKLLHQVALPLTGFNEIVESRCFGASEDASYLVQRVQQCGGQAVYFCIGADIAAGHHNSHFDFDETRLLAGLELFYEMIQTLQSKN